MNPVNRRTLQDILDDDAIDWETKRDAINKYTIDDVIADAIVEHEIRMAEAAENARKGTSDEHSIDFYQWHRGLFTQWIYNDYVSPAMKEGDREYLSLIGDKIEEQRKWDADFLSEQGIGIEKTRHLNEIDEAYIEDKLKGLFNTDTLQDLPPNFIRQLVQVGNQEAFEHLLLDLMLQAFNNKDGEAQWSALVDFLEIPRERFTKAMPLPTDTRYKAHRKEKRFYLRNREQSFPTYNSSAYIEALYELLRERKRVSEDCNRWKAVWSAEKKLNYLKHSIKKDVDRIYWELEKGTYKYDKRQDNKDREKIVSIPFSDMVCTPLDGDGIADHRGIYNSALSYEASIKDSGFSASPLRISHIRMDIENSDLLQCDKEVLVALHDGTEDRDTAIIKFFGGDSHSKWTAFVRRVKRRFPRGYFAPNQCQYQNVNKKFKHEKIIYTESVHGTDYIGLKADEQVIKGSILNRIIEMRSDCTACQKICEYRGERSSSHIVECCRCGKEYDDLIRPRVTGNYCSVYCYTCDMYISNDYDLWYPEGREDDIND